MKRYPKICVSSLLPVLMLGRSDRVADGRQKKKEAAQTATKWPPRAKTRFPMSQSFLRAMRDVVQTYEAVGSYRVAASMCKSGLQDHRAH